MDLEKIKKESIEGVKKSQNLAELEEIFRRYLGKKGEISLAFQKITQEPISQRKKSGQTLNEIKKSLEKVIEDKKKSIQEKILDEKSKENAIDVHQPGEKFSLGHLHPLSVVVRQVEDIFQLMGFSIAEGPELETEYYNFDALNIPADHPARDVWDTFWLNKKGKNQEKALLRTHTSPNQIRYMEKNDPPLRIIVPGICYRHEATDSSHGFQFMQIEGLMVGKEVSLANFKAVIEKFCTMFFGTETVFRILPDYFPFTEPSLEISIQDKKGNWLEIMGAGLVHPNVFKSAGYNPYEWQGFAFGMGVERLAMIKYGLDDIRMLYQGDLRLIKQF